MTLALGFTVVACGSSTPAALTATDAWVRFAGDNGAAYVVVKNTTADADALTGVTVSPDIATSAELHKTTTNERDMMGMQATPNVDVPADFTLKMNPGGVHIMLMNVKNAPAAGTRVPLTLRFQHHEPITIDAEVRS